VFDPNTHRFGERDEAIIQMLQSIYRNEQSYRRLIAGYSGSSGDRALYIPPSSWEPLFALLQQANARFELNGAQLGRLEQRGEAVPLQFTMDQGPVDRAYSIRLDGLQDMKLLPEYGFAVTSDGGLYPLDTQTMKRIEQLQSKMSSWAEKTLVVPPDKVDAYLRTVVPELKKLGEFSVADSIAGQIVNDPLQATVYLDRSGEQLTANVLFAYGNIQFSPLKSGRESEKADQRIVMREPDKERAVSECLSQAGFRQIGELLWLEDEEAVYDFLYGSLERLQRLASVYVTEAVQATRLERPLRPKATIDVDASTNWLEVRFDVPGIDEAELVKLLRSLSEKKKYHRLANGAFVSLADESFGELGRLIEQLGVRKSELKSGSVRLPVVRGLALAEQEPASGSASNVKLGKALRQMLDNLKNPDNLDFELPETLQPVLRDYQRFGFQWMRTLGYYGFGGILADDMGLGKTLQSIAYIASLQGQGTPEGGSSGPALIVCPASLVYNWRNELAKFAPQLTAVVAAGNKAERDAVLEDTSAVDVLITSYPLLRRDLEWYEQRSFHTLILDEAQAIKNNATQTAQAVKSLTSAHRFALTGTPVENRLEELWSIFDAVFPQLFVGRKSFNGLTPEQVARKVRPFLLRRLKKDVLTELPDKIETLQTSELLPEQKKLYMAYLLQLQQETVQQLEEDGFQKSRLKILAGLTRLRQLCCHPSLFLDNYEGESGKLEQLLELLDEYTQAGRRVLIFSQFTSMLALIREQVERRGWTYFYLDGATKPSERVELCRRFNEGESQLFLISLKAGGTGLNLTGADTVILYDLWWNPAVEQQAADRAHRIGQKNVVQVIRLMTEGTIEEKMYELQQRKKDLIDTVVQPGEESVSALSETDIRELLSI
ncbi:MAG: helicase, partial [Paenibacillus sp.]|nr:helicase [Paenibacillus sp.]